MNRYWQNKIAQLICLVVGVYATSVLMAKFAPPLRWDIEKKEVPVEFSAAQGTEDIKGKAGSAEGQAAVAVTPFPMQSAQRSSPSKVPEVKVPENKDVPAPTLAPLSPQETAPTPPSIGVYPEERLGNVLVFQVTVNEHNIIVDSELKVPSYDALYDISMVTGAFGQKVANVYPPIAKGELRKIDVRMQLPEEFAESRALLEKQRRLEKGLPPQEYFIPPTQLLP